MAPEGGGVSDHLIYLKGQSSSDSTGPAGPSLARVPEVRGCLHRLMRLHLKRHDKSRPLPPPLHPDVPSQSQGAFTYSHVRAVSSVADTPAGAP